MQHVLTLVAPPEELSPACLSRVAKALTALGAECGEPDWLSEREAADIPFRHLSPQAAMATAQTALEGLPVDAIAQPLAIRRKALLVADMDSTIVAGETLDELAAQAGLKERIAAITARAMNGELDFASALRERVAMLAGLEESALERTWAALRIMPGAPELIATMRAAGAHTVLVSGGFTFFTARVADLLGFDEHRSNILEVAGGVLSGRVKEPILDKDAKLSILRERAAARGLPLELALAVGDGANDLPMLLAAGLGVAFRAKPSVQAAARVRINHADLCALLFAQGFRRAEFCPGRDLRLPEHKAL
ncbi:MAG: phosphoserine phosphatase SerB [Rhodovarius sp.]|nr:phosphoserine phosphatase SerB [Rhodovarius sp.]MCX7933112.1 phosphoserine phosphatase SerB [Rhodovarius sp.]MDW8313391.1 phosphoserine phosphatase SerB [Rhodovarius sp.]